VSELVREDVLVFGITAEPELASAVPSIIILRPIAVRVSNVFANTFGADAEIIEIILGRRSS